MKKVIAGLFFAASIISCQQKTENIQTNSNSEINTEVVTPQKQTAKDFSGNYVDASYADRAKGNDWVSASVNKVDDNTISVSIRSRADIKKPTCTFDTKATKKSENIYEAKANDATILFTFDGDKITVSTEKQDDAQKLMYFCSGGGNFIGTYTKINEPLDEKQIDKTPGKF